MPGLNWDAFASLPGSAETNFELLCRGIVRHNYGSYGVLRALANQPGVEFHLKLKRRSAALGDPGRWWGWQCKWYDLPASGALGATRRKKIEEGIRKTEKHVPGITDWVLWTRETLTKADQKWFEGLSSKMTLHLWTADEVDNLLVGQASIFRSTYFGDLILTPDSLRERHEQSVAPIRARWQPEVHHVVDAERALRRMLGESDSWDALRAVAEDMRTQVRATESAPAVPAPVASSVSCVVETAKLFADALDRVADAVRDGDIDLLGDELNAQPRAMTAEVATAPRRLRSGNHQAGLYVTNAVAGCRETLDLFSAVEEAFSSRVVALVAPAGCGKTHLAAQLTAATDSRSDGVLLHGRDLHASHTLDDLARRVTVAGQPVQTMELLLAAVDAAGQRARHRLPVVIDGLNESEDPRVWKAQLASLDTVLAKYPYVLLVCTIRPEFQDEALPAGTRRVEITDYGVDAIDAIRLYFRHWKIDAIDASLPGFLRHPLTLRLFCEVTNPTREKVVGIDAMPGSLTALFDRYLDQIGDRIADLAPRTQRYYAQDVRAALTTFAKLLWESRDRAVDPSHLRRALGDDGRPWDQSLVRALEHEGVLLRMPSNSGGAYVPVYDRLGGHIIATALLAKHGQAGFDAWIREPTTTALLAGDYYERHPLGGDIVYSLVGQIPRRFYSKQLWQLVDEPIRARALRTAARLEAAYLDAATVDALLDLVRSGDADLLQLLLETRGAANHPLNAAALDQALRPMGVAERDLRWTEWLRRNQDDALKDLKRLAERWHHGGVHAGDQLRVRWVMWTLTTSVRLMRDQATVALYWFGRADPGGLFELTLDALSVNDTYVGERMLAASYGVVMSHQQEPAALAQALQVLLVGLENALVGPSATAPTLHYLARMYAKGIVEFGAKFCPATLPGGLRGDWAFAAPAHVTPIPKGDPRADELKHTLQMDFENYTLGRLCGDRANYDMNHEGHKAAVAYVLGVTWGLGWRADTFEAVDRDIAEQVYRGRGHRPLAERYGKKYGWIGFFAYAGLLEDSGRFPREGRPFTDVDIDPSFPEGPPVDCRGDMPSAWLSPDVQSHESWVREDSTSIARELLVRQKLGEHDGPWILVHGFLKAEDRLLGREAWAFVSAMVVDKSAATALVAALKGGSRPWVARDVPSDHYTFAGEIPWNHRFAAESLEESGPDHAYRENVQTNSGSVAVEVLAHNYAWESYHSDMNRAGSARVPSWQFSTRFDLRGVPQGFDQCLPDGARATITLSGVDGLDGDVLYIREDLLRQYVGDHAVVWFAFGERELRPYPPSPPQWLVDAQRQSINAWSVTLTEEDLTPTKAKKGAPKKKAPKGAAPKPAKKTARRTTAKAPKKKAQAKKKPTGRKS
ncbi:MAG: ATP-binding protein [Myxococcales bacterium]|nr:ATP-binding protein [Myxococcales bacterium]